MVSLDQRRFLFVTGKGGAGKTTVSAALALALSARGRRVLLATSGAKERISPLFAGAELGTSIEPLADGVWGVLLTPEVALREYGTLVLKSPKLVDALSFDVIASHPAAAALRPRWMASPRPCVGRAGWNLQIAELLRRDPDSPPPSAEALFRRIWKGLAAAPHPKQEAMNRCLVELGVRFPALTVRALGLGVKIGRLDGRAAPKGSVSTYAPEWIAAGIRKRRK